MIALPCFAITLGAEMIINVLEVVIERFIFFEVIFEQ